MLSLTVLHLRGLVPEAPLAHVCRRNLGRALAWGAWDASSVGVHVALHHKVPCTLQGCEAPP